ncbi:hypothetical protein VP01_10149g1, partial [Puccinia sorghi]
RRRLTDSVEAKVEKDPDGYCKLKGHLPEQKNFIGKWFYLVSGPLFDEVKQKNNALEAPVLEPNFKEDPNGFTCHLSFTISKFANLTVEFFDGRSQRYFFEDIKDRQIISTLTHKDNNASPFTFVMWIPIEQTTGNL